MLTLNSKFKNKKIKRNKNRNEKINENKSSPLSSTLTYSVFYNKVYLFSNLNLCQYFATETSTKYSYLGLYYEVIVPFKYSFLLFST